MNFKINSVIYRIKNIFGACLLAVVMCALSMVLCVDAFAETKVTVVEKGDLTVSEPVVVGNTLSFGIKGPNGETIKIEKEVAGLNLLEQTTVDGVCFLKFEIKNNISAQYSIIVKVNDKESKIVLKVITENSQSATDGSSAVLSGNPSEIKLTNLYTQGAGYGQVAGIHFRAELDRDYIASAEGVANLESGANNVIYVKPVSNSSDPFVMDACYHQIAYQTEDNEKDKDGNDIPNTRAKYVDAGFVFNVKGDVKTGYYPVTFEIQYNKNGQTYTVNKTVDIDVYGKEEETTTQDGNVSVPRIIVTGFETNPEKVMAGDEFELTIHLMNTSNRTAVNNIEVTLNSTDSVFLPSSGSSTQFIRSIACGKTKDIKIMMKAQANLDQKPYVLSVECEYEGEKNAPYKASENISIPVYQEAKCMITEMMVNPEAIEIFNQANISFNINNTGKATLYNVQVSIDPACKSVTSEGGFVGNISPGASGYADFMVTGQETTTDDGSVKVIISYEDANGETGKFEQLVNLFVYEPVYEEFPNMGDGEFIDPGMVEEKGFPWAAVIAVIVVIIVIVVIVVVIKNKKRKALKEELEDEIS